MKQPTLRKVHHQEKRKTSRCNSDWNNKRNYNKGLISMSNFYTIKDAAKITGLSEYTLRFYEKQGLILNVRRDANGYRKYSEFDIEWINFLIKVKDTSMPLKDLQQYACLVSQGKSTILQREEMLMLHKKRIIEEIDKLNITLMKIDEKLLRYQRIKNESSSDELELYAHLETKQNQ